MKKAGKVYLIGAGPGDPGLITVRGREALGRADVVVYDYLVNRKLLEGVKEGAEVVYVGKKAGSREMTQAGINRLLASRAKKGKTVARLKGGDPFIFGRGGEEASALADAGIEFEVVPGVTSASAVPAYAGIPLTHRDLTSSFAVVTGHEDPSKKAPVIEWDVLARMGTVIFLMGVKNLGGNMKRLVNAGMSADTPAAVITWGTYPSQTAVAGTVGDIAAKVKRRKDITSPAIVVTGEVVGLRDKISWFEKKPLFGKTIVVTRPREQAGALTRLLEDLGSDVIEFPAIEIRPPRSWRELDRAIDNMDSYDWIVFTSVNGAAQFFNRLASLGGDIRILHGLRIAAIGEMTAGDIEARGLRVDLLPGDYRAEGLIDLFAKEKMDGARVLIPRAKEAREVLPEKLRGMGAHVDVVAVYETRRPARSKVTALRKLIADGKIDVVTFTSSSTVRNFLDAAGDIKQISGKPAFACIGPVTEKTLRDAGYEARIVPAEYTAARLAGAIADYFGRGGRNEKRTRGRR